MSDTPVELIPGTALPITAPSEAAQIEGRGQVLTTGDHLPVSMFESGVPDPTALTDADRMFIRSVLDSYDNRTPRVSCVDARVGGTTDATTGNLILQLYECPQGCELHIVNVTVDAPQSSTITPSAPFANASSYAYLSVAPPSSSPDVRQMRNGLVAFAPTAAAGPIVPGQWVFDNSDARICWGGDAVYYVLVGGSISGIRSQMINVSFRFNIYKR